MNLQRMLSAWDIPHPVITREIGGINNLSFEVSSDDGRFILRLYRTTGDLDRVRFEHALLMALSGADLPFAVPVPLPTRSGETLASEDTTVVALFPFIPGVHPDGSTIDQFRACGRALGHLDRAMAALQGLPENLALHTTDDLCSIDPHVPDPFTLAEGLSLSREDRDRITTILRDVADRVPLLYRTLPLQIVHSDVDFGNVLMEGDEVAGILDFEFARRDVRVLELGWSLAQMGSHPWQTPERPRQLAALGRAYSEIIPLTREELEAIPTAMLFFRASSLIRREARRRIGIATEGDVLSRARELIRMDAWLKEMGGELVGGL